MLATALEQLPVSVKSLIELILRYQYLVRELQLDGLGPLRHFGCHCWLPLRPHVASFFGQEVAAAEVGLRPREMGCGSARDSLKFFEHSGDALEGFDSFQLTYFILSDDMEIILISLGFWGFGAFKRS